MANIQIKDLVTVIPTSVDLIPISQSGNTRSATVEEIRDKALRTEVENARGTSATLDERMDLVDTSLSEKANQSDLLQLMNDRGYFNTKVISGTDLNNIVKSGIYAGNNLINAPQNNVWFTLEVFNTSNDSYTVQRAMGFADGGTNTYERRNNLGTWTAWKQLATAILPTEFTITGLNGFTAISGSKATYCKTQEGVVIIDCYLQKSAGQTGATSLFTLPAGYRPANNSAVRAVANIGINRCCSVIIMSDGTTSIEDLDGSVFNVIKFTVSFVAGN